MYHRLYFHLVWTTRDRQLLIDNAVAGFLCRILRSVARKERAYILEIGLVQTHVHLLARLHPMANISKLVQRTKAVSATVANKEGNAMNGAGLLWAKGYAAKTVSPETLESVRAYLRNQPNHHPTEAIPGWSGDSDREFDSSSRRILSPQPD